MYDETRKNQEYRKRRELAKPNSLRFQPNGSFMKINVIIHKAEEGGYWAEVPAIPGCATQGETMDTLIANIREAIEGCLSVTVPESCGSEQEVLELVI